MAFTESWIETDPDGAIITGSLLDDYQRATKRQIRERLEGDPANPNSGIFESLGGGFASAAVVKAGSARAYSVAFASLAALTLQDGRIAITSDTRRLYHLKSSGLVELAYAPLTGAAFTGAVSISTGGLTVTAGTTAVQAFTATSGAFTAGVAISGTSLITVPTNTSLILNTSNNVPADFNQLLFQRGGISKWRFGPNIDGANIDTLVFYSDVSAVYALRLTTFGGVVFGNGVTISTGGLISTPGGITINGVGLAVTGGIIVSTGDVNVGAGNLTFSTAIARIVGGPTSTAFRNNINGADNILIADNGVITLRNTLVAVGVSNSGAYSVSGAAFAGAGLLVLGYGTSGTATSGGAGALPATPLGYFQWSYNNVNVRVPYYNV